MSSAQRVRLVSREAGSAVTIYRVVGQLADGQVDHVADATVNPLGIAAESVAAAGDSLPVATEGSGILKVEAGAAITIGAELEAAGDGTGRVITHTSGVGDYRLGTALSAAGAAGDIIEVQLRVSLDEVA
tara:strand:+ start:357 stop:746 length:390 start_codon:yes stop_codon:yes gene_type:complete